MYIVFVCDCLSDCTYVSNYTVSNYERIVYMYTYVELPFSNLIRIMCNEGSLYIHIEV